MFRNRKAGLGLALLMGLTVISPVMAQDSGATIKKANTTLTDIKSLVDGISKRQAEAASTQTTPAQQPTARVVLAGGDETYKCPACGMAMTSKKTASNTKMVTIKGKKWYCCAGCDMSKVVDKPAKKAATTPKKKKNP